MLLVDTSVSEVSSPISEILYMSSSVDRRKSCRGSSSHTPISMMARVSLLAVHVSISGTRVCARMQRRLLNITTLQIANNYGNKWQHYHFFSSPHRFNPV